MKRPLPCLIVTLLLSGCQSLGLRPAPAGPGLPPSQCQVPATLPALSDDQATTVHWLRLQNAIASGPLPEQWRLLQNYSAFEPRQARLAAALVTSRPDMPEALRRLGWYSLHQQQAQLPTALQPLVSLVQQHNRAALERDVSRRQLTAVRYRLLQLEQALTEKERQLEALTAIESQLNHDKNRPRNPQ